MVKWVCFCFLVIGFGVDYHMTDFVGSWLFPWLVTSEFSIFLDSTQMLTIIVETRCNNCRDVTL